MNYLSIFFEKDDNFDCNRLDLDTDNGEKEYIGFGNNFLNILMIFFSFFGIFINLYFFWSSIRRISKNKKSNESNLSSIEKILCVISVTETCISICWLINSFSMSDTEKSIEHCDSCRVLGNFELFFYIFDWMILSSTLYQIKKMLINPLETLKTEKYIIRYIIFCAFFGIIMVILGYFADIESVSPMLTCFIDVVGWDYADDEKVLKTIFYILFFCIPISILFFGIFLVYQIIKLPQYKNNKKNRKFFKSYLHYIITYIILALLLISVYILDYFIDQEVPKKGMKIYINFVTHLSCATPLIVGTIRLVKTTLVKKFLLFCFCNKKRRNNNIDYSKNDESEIFQRDDRSTNNDYQFVEFEQDLICKEFKKIFIGISYILDKSKKMEEEEEEKERVEEKNEENIINKDNTINKKNSINIEDSFKGEKEINNVYKIDKNEILKDFDLNINEDIFVLDQEEVNIEAIEYFPKFFKNIRKAENLEEEQIAKYFQPKNVRPDLFMKTNDSNYYINSTNKQFILKSINLEQIEFYKNNLKERKINEYLENHPDSIINRVYGLYYLKIDDTKDYYIALMENIYETIDQLFFSNNNNNLKSDECENIILDNSSNKTNNDIEKQMYFNENEINEKIVNNNSEEDNILDISRRRTVRRTLLKKESSIFINEKKFKIFLDENEYNRLKGIIQRDVKFLKEAGSNPQFFVVQKPVQISASINLLNKNIGEDNQEDEKRPKKEIGIKKYIFKSNIENLIYCITISGYFKNYQE